MRDQIEQLIEDYKRRLKTITDDHKIGYDAIIVNRLRVRAGCFRTFIAELEAIKLKDTITDVDLKQIDQASEEYYKRDKLFERKK